MPEETQTEEPGQSEETAEQTAPPELPDDPAERATALEAQLAAAAEESRRLKVENERLAEERKELDAGRKTYHRLYEEERARNQSQSKDPVKPDTSDRFWFNDDGTPKEMADFVAERVPLREILKRAGVVTKAELDKQLDERVKAETTKGATLRDLVTAYPEMADDNSPLKQAAADEFMKLDSGLDEVTRWELATARAARRINYAPKAKSSEDTERERRRNGQGGPKGAISTKTPLVVTDQMRKEAQRMNGGQEVPDDLLLATLKRQQQDRQSLSRT